MLVHCPNDVRDSVWMILLAFPIPVVPWLEESCAQGFKFLFKDRGGGRQEGKGHLFTNLYLFICEVVLSPTLLVLVKTGQIFIL